MIKSKNLKRIWLIIAGFAKNYSSPLFNALLALYVIRSYSADVWGSFVKIQIVVTLASQFSNWASKNHLLREFSKTPSRITELWESAFSSRLPILLLASAATFFFAGTAVIGLLAIGWLLVRYLILSYEPLILYKRSYLPGTFADLISFLICISAVVILPDLNTEKILLCVIAGDLVETIVIIFYFRKDVLPRFHRFRFRTYMKETYWMFFLGFSGYAGSRADLICATAFLGSRELAFYQLLVNFLMGLQSVSNILFLPFIRNLYRFRNERILQFSRRLFIYGVGICSVTIPVIWFVLEKIYLFEASGSLMLLCLLSVLPVYYYSLIIYLFLKNNYDRMMFAINWAGIAVNVICSVILLKLYGVSGGILAATISHVVVLALCDLQVRRLKNVLFQAEINLPAGSE